MSARYTSGVPDKETLIEMDIDEESPVRPGLIPRPRKCVRQQAETADESLDEIRWDNHSPATSWDKRARGGGSDNSSIAAILQDVRMKKWPVEEAEVKDESAFSTWMVQKLAPCACGEKTNAERKSSRRVAE